VLSFDLSGKGGPTSSYSTASIACLNRILWSKNKRKERKLNVFNAVIKSSLLYGSETWRLTENNKRWVEATEMDALRRSSRISRKERIKNVTIRQRIGLKETIVKEIEQKYNELAVFSVFLCLEPIS
jgi:hypothetical protein